MVLLSYFNFSNYLCWGDCFISDKERVVGEGKFGKWRWNIRGNLCWGVGGGGWVNLIGGGLLKKEESGGWWLCLGLIFVSYRW